MADEPLFTLKQVAEQLGRPESTVRYYRDSYLDQIPFVGTGRRRRYPPEAVAVLRSIAESYATGGSRASVVGDLHRNSGSHQVAAIAPLEQQKTHEHVTNLELLAAILDGEREQRDALWQMAQEIVRLSQVLQEQDTVLISIAERAGVAQLGPGAARGTERALPGSTESSPTAAQPPTPGAQAMDDLRAELEKERALVERLREAKLQLEHRTAEAEAALATPPMRKSMIRRLLGGDE